MPADAPIVFISYAHSSPEHKERVADLVQTLRAAGVTVTVDADVTTPQGPPEGWPRWMDQQIEEADWVLIFFDEVYRRRFNGREVAGTGLGATWEATIIAHQLYQDGTRNEKFIPLLTDDAENSLIPLVLSGANRYRIPKHADKLAIALMQTAAAGSTGILPPQPPEISPPRLHHGADHLFGRKKELARLDAAWADPGTNVVTLVAWGGVGKTSLVVEWMARQAKKEWAGFERVFDWSFYSQGTSDQRTVSADAFVEKALTFFGDEPLAKSAASAWDKGVQLAKLVGERATLLVLDGLEPLQHPPGPLAGKLKDPAVESLLRGLARRNRGLCVVTTREPVVDLAAYQDATAPEWKLDQLSDEAGAALLHRAGATRAGQVKIEADDKELRDASREVGGHALTLRLLGNYIKLAHHGDIRQRSLVKFDEADKQYKTNPDDADKPYGHAFKVMGVYENWLASGGEDGGRQLAVLRMMGLFDRPADASCIAALRADPGIDGLTDAIAGLTEIDWNIVLSRLGECGLVVAAEEKSTLDAHPLIREYFAKQLREESPEAWRAGHKRLYEHLTSTTKDKPDATLEDLQPLYQAVAHGCHAGLHQKVCDEVYNGRIKRGPKHYSNNKFGAFGANLGAVACFFETPWSRVSPSLSEDHHAWLLNEAASSLRALGRLAEAKEPMRASLAMYVAQKHWTSSAGAAENLSELKLTLGDVAGAVSDAEQCVTFADRSGEEGHQLIMRTVLGDALHQGGREADALRHFRDSETMQVEWQPEYPLLYSMPGAQYCDLLLAQTERVAWGDATTPKAVSNRRTAQRAASIDRCQEVEKRAVQTLKWARDIWEGSLLTIAFDHLTLGRVALYRGVLTDSKKDHAEALVTARRHLADAVDGLRRSGQQDDVPRGLLSRGWLRFTEGDKDGARADLDEAWEIAERGGMRLYMADVHLHRARLFRDAESLSKAAELIAECGYGRRNEELEDAQRASKTW